MTAPAVAADAPRTTRRPAVQRRGDRWAGVVEGCFRLHTALVYAFLYLPIVVVVMFAFNDTATVDQPLGRLHAEVVRRRAQRRPSSRTALRNSFIVAIPNAILATAFGTMAALGLQRVGKRLRLAFDTLTYMSVIVPEIVIALSTLVLFATGFDALETIFGIKLNFGHADDHRRARAVQHQPRAAARAGAPVGDGPLAGRCQRRPVRDAVADVPPDHVPAAAAGDRRGVPAVVHVQLRRLRDHDVRVRARAPRRCRCSSSARSSAG